MKAPFGTATVAPPNEPPIGPYVILRRTDGEIILYDGECPLGHRTVHGKTFTDIPAAKRYALALLNPASTKGRAA